MRLAAGDPQRKVSALGPHAPEALYQGCIAWEGAAVVALRPARDLPDLRRLGSVEAGVPDEAVERGQVEPGDGRRRRGGGEEALGRHQTDLVARANGEDAGDHLLEERSMSRFRQREHRRLGKRPDRPADPPQRQGDDERPFPSGA